ncbi:YggT family protein [Myxacorys almedinensis]|uniref:YggT family protein n=1 Tax=Myxacorys almedinensis A TaxID=2690445 RepID=A0A8J7Z7U2_9CYAN|nr:YggT family protein [Myxacorys almedinensis]NDJ19526.1 YggT family protein [Myxacorys almedinensis A]
MSRDPYDSDNIERRREIQREEEAFRLQQEEQRLDMARRNSSLAWIINGVLLLIGLLEILLGLRFLLRVSGANPDNAVARFIYDLSDPFVAPFSTLFVSPTSSGATNIFDVNVLIAIVVYAVLGWIAIALLRFLQGR